jgi:hypothetical protein
MVKKTLAYYLGDTFILSSVKNKLKKCGIVTPEEMEELAFQRGCYHYGEANYPEGPKTKNISDTELGIAFLHPSNTYNPRWIRIGVQLCSRESNPKKLIRLARWERCLHILRKIASDAIIVEPDNVFWKEILNSQPLKSNPPIKTDVFPHWSRYTKSTGLTNPFMKNKPNIEWIR